jgi:hypothetical protein
MMMQLEKPVDVPQPSAHGLLLENTNDCGPQMNQHLSSIEMTASKNEERLSGRKRIVIVGLGMVAISFMYRDPHGREGQYANMIQ